jgi:hypothetical protein
VPASDRHTGEDEARQHEAGKNRALPAQYQAKIDMGCPDGIHQYGSKDGVPFGGKPTARQRRNAPYWHNGQVQTGLGGQHGWRIASRRPATQFLAGSFLAFLRGCFFGLASISRTRAATNAFSVLPFSMLSRASSIGQAR